MVVVTPMNIMVAVVAAAFSHLTFADLIVAVAFAFIIVIVRVNQGFDNLRLGRYWESLTFSFFSIFLLF